LFFHPFQTSRDQNSGFRRRNKGFFVFDLPEGGFVCMFSLEGKWNEVIGRIFRTNMFRSCL